MSRYYQLFKTRAERELWELEQKKKNENFRVCMRMTAIQLKEELPFVDINGFEFCTIWTNDY